MKAQTDVSNVGKKILADYLLELKRPILDVEVKKTFNISYEEIECLISEFQIGIEYKLDIDLNLIKYSVYMDTQSLKEFIKTEIEIFLEDNNRATSMSEIFDKCYKSFCNTFGFPMLEEVDYGLRFDKLIKMIDIVLNESPEKFHKLLDLRKSNENDFIVLKTWESKSLITQYSRFESAILYNFRKSKKEILELKNLDFRLNRLPFIYDVPKPISLEYIISQLQNESDIYHFDEANEKIIHKEDLKRIKKKLINLTMKYRDFGNFISSIWRTTSGIISIKYSGLDFPLKEASEYVNLRNIIFISKTYNVLTDFKKLFDFENINDSKFLLILSSIIGEDNLREWIEENIKISFYEEYFEPTDNELGDLEKRIIEDISPLLNLDGNPGNLFRITLEDKLNAYLEGKKSIDESK
jgi:hypothetical protein